MTAIAASASVSGASSLESGLASQIDALRQQVSAARTLRAHYKTTLLSSSLTERRILRAEARHLGRPSPPPNTNSTISSPADDDELARLPLPLREALDSLNAQKRHNTENLFRAVTGVTAFKVKDPDPAAVDGGKVLGVRIEVCVEGKFIAPYYLLLNRPWSTTSQSAGGEATSFAQANASTANNSANDQINDAEASETTTPASDRSTSFRVHKHTIPPSIPLSPLIETYLPSPSTDSSSAPSHTTQDLHKLVYALRHELTAWHKRRAAVRKLRRDAGLPARPDGKEDYLEEEDEQNASIREASRRTRRGGRKRKHGRASTKPLVPAGAEQPRARRPLGKDGIASISATDPTATEIRIVWAASRANSSSAYTSAITSSARESSHLEARLLVSPLSGTIAKAAVLLRDSDDARGSGGNRSIRDEADLGLGLDLDLDIAAKSGQDMAAMIRKKRRIQHALLAGDAGLEGAVERILQAEETERERSRTRTRAEGTEDEEVDEDEDEEDEDEDVEQEDEDEQEDEVEPSAEDEQ